MQDEVALRTQSWYHISPVMPATAHAMWSSSLYIFSRRTPTALVSNSCIQRRPLAFTGALAQKTTMNRVAARWRHQHLRCDLLLCCEHHPVLREHPNGGAGIGDGLHCVLDLEEAPFWTEGGGASVIASRHGA